MTHARARLLPCLALTSLLGCADLSAPIEGPEIVGSEASEIANVNALNPNALNPNALNPNALSPSALSAAALSPGALSPATLAAITDPGVAGILSRQFLRYAAGCALAPADAFSFSWTDSAGVVHAESFHGVLGLAPAWITRKLSEAEQRWVTACLASRTNWYGTQVVISSLADRDGLKEPSAIEGATYTKREGAFWGNVFAASPGIHACFVAPNVANSRAQYRDCAAGHLSASGIQSCGIIHIVGSCRDYCESSDDHGYYEKCASFPDGSHVSDKVITTFLPEATAASDPGG